jgi:hypothetical protein
VLWEGIRTAHKTIFRVPHGSRPHGHERSLALCVNDPACWQSTPVLSKPDPKERTGVDQSKLGLVLTRNLTKKSRGREPWTSICPTLDACICCPGCRRTIFLYFFIFLPLVFLPILWLYQKSEVRLYIYTHTHTHTHVYIYICIYVYIHIYIYIYIHQTSEVRLF